MNLLPWLQKCPQCRLFRCIEYKDEITFIICKSCGYDELQQGSVTIKRTSQREKMRFSRIKQAEKEERGNKYAQATMQDKHSGYYEAILQLRDISDDVFDFVEKK